MRVGVIGTEYDIIPVSGIEQLFSLLEELYDGSVAYAVFGTYTFTPEISSRLTKIFEVVRVFAGRMPSGKYGGVHVTQAQIHFKGMISWDTKRTVSYIGSSNLTFESGGNYGIVFIKNDSFYGFNTEATLNGYREFHDPIEVIFNDIVSRETGGRCEKCKEPSKFLVLDKVGRLVCQRCKQ